MSELNGGWSITGQEVVSNSGDFTPSFSSQYKGFLSNNIKSNDALNEILDAKKILSELKGDRKIIFSEYYILGKKIREIEALHPNLKYYQIRRHITYIDGIYKTLIKGETPCLQ